MATITVSNGEIATVPVGQTDTDDVVQSGGTLDVFGTASRTDLERGGIINVSSGGVAENTFNGGTENIFGTDIGAILLNGTEIINSGGVASNTNVERSGIAEVNSGGTATGTIVTLGGALD